MPPPSGCSGPFAANLLTLFSMLIAAGSISAMVFAGPRVYYAMARDGLFFSAAARVHPTWRTPVISIIAQSLFCALLVVSGTLDQLANYTGFAIVLFASIAVSALFVLRRRQPERAAAIPRARLPDCAGDLCPRGLRHCLE